MFDFQVCVLSRITKEGGNFISKCYPFKWSLIDKDAEDALLTSDILPSHGYHGLIEHIFEGKEECSRDSTLGNLGTNAFED